jgi:MSHA biogenesis protein MshQ
MKKLLLGFVWVALGMATHLQAATLAFDWTTGLAGLGPTCAFGNSSQCATLGYYTKTMSGVTATVSANTTGQASDKVNYRQSSMGSIIGLGVYCTSGCFLDSGEMGSDLFKGQGREVLKFAFGKTVTLTQIKFYGVTAGTARLTYGATTVDIAVAGGGNQTHTLATPASVSSFTIAARGAIASFRITGTTVTAASVASSLTLSSSSSASVCSGLPVTISAVDSGGALVTDYTGTVTLSTSTGHGTWSQSVASGSLTAGSDNGSATYSFVAGDGGTKILTLTNTHADTLTISAVEGALSVSSGSIGFSENAFVITNSNSDIVAGRGHSFTATMWTKDSTTGLCAAAANYTGSKDLKAWISRDGSDPGGTAPTISGTSLTNNVASANTVSGMSFTAGVCNFTLATTDVGKYAVNLRDASGTFANTNIDGASSAYVVRPFGLAINPGASSTATTASGTAFKKAGQTFATTVTAVGYQLADDANTDGVPDSGADLSNNSATASFNASTTLTHALVLPASGASGTLTGGGALSGFTAGAKTASLSFDEVGIINLSAVSNDYLGSSVSDITGSTLNIGRFYPDHFALSSLVMDAFCTTATDFTYMGQPTDMTFVLQAENATNAVTANYHGDFAKLVLSSAYKAVDITVPLVPVNVAARISNTAPGSWSNGVASVNSVVTFNRNSLPDAAYPSFRFGLTATDSDGATLAGGFDLDSNGDMVSDAKILLSTAMRYGRLALDNAVGSELSALAVPARFEYYDGSNGFVANTDDVLTCSASDIVTGNFTTANWNGSGAEPVLTASAGSTAGQMSVLFAAPVSGSAGSVDIEGTTVPAWLWFNWDKQSLIDTSDEAPTAKAVFGINPGSAPVIYRRESFRN